jgi:hypothetical protein
MEPSWDSSLWQQECVALLRGSATINQLIVANEVTLNEAKDAHRAPRYLLSSCIWPIEGDFAPS